MRSFQLEHPIKLEMITGILLVNAANGIWISVRLICNVAQGLNYCKPSAAIFASLIKVLQCEICCATQLYTYLHKHLPPFGGLNA